MSWVACLVAILLSCAFAERLHVASVSKYASEVAAVWYDESVANDVNEQWNLDNHDKNVRVELRYNEARNYQVLSSDWKKIASSAYTLVINRYTTDFSPIDSQLFVAEGHMCATNKFTTLGYPRQCTPYIQVYEFNPSLNKTLYIKDYSNYDSSAHLTGFYCCDGDNRDCDTLPSSVCPAFKVLPTVAKYFNTTIVGALPDTYEHAADIAFSDVLVDTEDVRDLQSVVDKFMKYIQNGRSVSSVFRHNVEVCLPHSSACDASATDLFRFMTNTYGKMKFSIHDVFVASKSKLYLTGVSEIQGSKSYEIFNLAFSLEVVNSKIARVVAATDMSIIGHANNFCVSDDVKCKKLPAGTSLVTRFGSYGVTDFESLA